MSTDVIDVSNGPDPEQMRSLRTFSWVSYGLHLVVALGAVLPGFQASMTVALVALIIDLVKRTDAQGSWLASHFSWRIRTLLWAALLYTVTAPLWLLLIAPGWVAWGIISIWFLYRIVKGMVRMDRQQEMAP